MGQPLVRFEVIGNDAANLRSYDGELFGWAFDTDVPVAEAVSEAGNYGFVDRYTTDDGTGVRGGVGGGAGSRAHAVFYVGVPDVEAAVQAAAVAVGHFTDPEGNLIGVPPLAPWSARRAMVLDVAPEAASSAGCVSWAGGRPRGPTPCPPSSVRQVLTRYTEPDTSLKKSQRPLSPTPISGRALRTTCLEEPSAARARTSGPALVVPPKKAT